jgi:hypothetical protein
VRSQVYSGKKTRTYSGRTDPGQRIRQKVETSTDPHKKTRTKPGEKTRAHPGKKTRVDSGKTLRIFW